MFLRLWPEESKVGQSHSVDLLGPCGPMREAESGWQEDWVIEGMGILRKVL